MGVQLNTLRFQTNCGEVTFECWDIAGQEMFRKLIDGYLIGAKAAILMFDVTSRTSYKNIPNHYRDVHRVCENIPMVLCGNKVDMFNRVVKPKQITFHTKKNLQYYDISAKTNYNFEKPFLYLARKLYKSTTLGFSEAPCNFAETSFADTSITPDLLKQYEAELLLAASFPPLDDDDDDFF